MIIIKFAIPNANAVISILLFVITDETSCLYKCHYTLEDYIEDDDIIHPQYANKLDIQVAFHANFQ